MGSIQRVRFTKSTHRQASMREKKGTSFGKMNVQVLHQRSFHGINLRTGPKKRLKDSSDALEARLGTLPKTFTRSKKRQSYILLTRGGLGILCCVHKRAGGNVITFGPHHFRPTTLLKPFFFAQICALANGAALRDNLLLMSCFLGHGPRCDGPPCPRLCGIPIVVWVSLLCCVVLCRVVVCRCGVCSKFSWVRPKFGTARALTDHEFEQSSGRDPAVGAIRVEFR